MNLNWNVMAGGLGPLRGRLPVSQRVVYAGASVPNRPISFDEKV